MIRDYLAGSRWVRRGAVLLALVATALCIRVLLARGYLVTGDSMSGTLLPGDWVLVNRAAVGPAMYHLGWRLPGYDDLDRFDLIVVRVGRADGPHTMMAKRVVGLPGDVLSMEGGELRIDGREVEEPYAQPLEENIHRSSRAMDWQLEFLAAGVDRARYFPTLGNWGPLKLPPGHFFLMGDNRDHSIDSREFGFVTRYDVVGRVERVLLSHDGSCCDPVSLVEGMRWGRVGLDPGGRASADGTEGSPVGRSLGGA